MRDSTASSSERSNATSCSNVSGTSWRWSGNCPSISRLVRRTSPMRKSACDSLSTTSTTSAFIAPTRRETSLERARRDDRLAGVGRRVVEGRLAHGEAVRVGGHHREPVLRDPHQDAGQHRAGLVARRGAGHPVDGLDQRLGGNRQAGALVGGQLGEVVRLQAVEGEGRAAAREADHALVGAVLQRDRPVGHRSARCRRPGAAAPTEPGSSTVIQRHPQRELHVGRRELDPRPPRRAGGRGRGSGSVLLAEAARPATPACRRARPSGETKRTARP